MAHDGPVLSLHCSPFNRSVLASGGGDHLVKVWDAASKELVHTYKQHGDKVQVVKWHPKEQAMLLTAGFDRKLGLVDVRKLEQATMLNLRGDAESAMWSWHRPFEVLASVDS